MISRRDEEGFSSCLACPCHRAVASTPPRQRCRIGQISAPHAAFALRLRARPSVSLIFEATFAFTVVTARWLVISPRKTLSIGFRVLVSLHPAIQTTGLLTLAPAGLSPAEHASLRWTHNRTSRFPASGSRTRLHAFAFACTVTIAASATSATTCVGVEKRLISHTDSGEAMKAPPPKPMMAMPVAMPSTPILATEIAECKNNYNSISIVQKRKTTNKSATLTTEVSISYSRLLFRSGRRLKLAAYN